MASPGAGVVKGPMWEWLKPSLYWWAEVWVFLVQSGAVACPLTPIAPASNDSGSCF